MNFKIYDDEFDENKTAYLEEIKSLQKKVITDQYKKDWDKFVKQVLIDTRSYYILIYALKIMHNLEQHNLYTSMNTKDFYNQCLLNSMTFMPDKTFLETAIMIVARFHKEGGKLALSQGVDVEDLIKKAKFAVKKEINQKKKSNE